MNMEHQQVKTDFSEFIRERFANGIAKRALWAAEQLGKRISFDNEYPDEDDEELICK